MIEIKEGVTEKGVIYYELRVKKNVVYLSRADYLELIERMSEYK